VANQRRPLTAELLAGEQLSHSDIVANIAPPPTSLAKLQINYIHHHIISFSPDFNDNERASIVQSLQTSILSNRIGQYQSSSSQLGPNDDQPSRPKEKINHIAINGFTLRYTSETLPEPPSLTYKTKGDLERLVEDWTSSTLITVGGMGIPLCLWKKLYKNIRPDVWKRIKDQWTKFKFIVGGYKSFESSEEFWRAMSLPPTLCNSKMVSFKKISAALRNMRMDRDREDASRARDAYPETEFRKMFSYRKHGKEHIMRRAQDVARRYRVHNKQTMYWDEEDSDD
jgi:hypothetical protein